MINPLKHYALENPASIYDEEAMTALELAGRTAKKVNEVINAVENQQNDNAQFSYEVRSKLTAQDKKLQQLEEYLPTLTRFEIEGYIRHGDFDQAISEYTHDLETRVDNLLNNIPEGGTTMDAEVIDIRVDDNGVTHDTAGNAIRTRLKTIVEQAKSMVYNSGVFPVPVTWTTKVSSDGKYYFETIPFKLPADGLSVRVSECMDGTLVPGAKLMSRVYYGYMVEGEFTNNDPAIEALNKKYGGNIYTNRINYTPYLEGVYAKIRCSLIGDGETKLTADNYQSVEPLIPVLCKGYTGLVKNGGNLLGFTPATLVQNSTSEEKYTPDWSMRGFIHKYTAITSPLPLEFVDRVSCGPHTWIGAKVYKFDPVTRTTEFVETLHHNQMHPCYGSECVIDFTGYGKNYFAILCAGYVPEYSEYFALQYQSYDAGTHGAERLGLDLSKVVNDIHVDWCGSSIRHTLPPGSPVVQKNVELLRGLSHKTVPARYARGKTTASFYLLGQDDFAGVYYGGGYSNGTFYYNVSPATYYTALLNPNSVAYGDADPALDGNHYGIVCSAFTALLHGYPFPLSTFDMRYNATLDMFEVKPFNLLTDGHKLKQYDLITQGVGETGHTVMVGDIVNVGDMATAVQVFESGTPSTRENVFFIHNGLNYYRANPESHFVEAYDFVAVTDPAKDQAIHDKANWTPAYTEPRPAMCSRGYGSVYVKGVNSVRVSFQEDVTYFKFSIDGENLSNSYTIADMDPVSMNGYNVVDITHLLTPGKITIRPGGYTDKEEMFYYIDVSDYSVTAETSTGEDNTFLYVNKWQDIKWINVIYKFMVGTYEGKNVSVNYDPKALEVENGVYKIPETIDTDIGHVWVHGHDGDTWKNYINVVFKTPYDTNTFAIDADGDAFN